MHKVPSLPATNNCKHKNLKHEFFWGGETSYASLDKNLKMKTGAMRNTDVHAKRKGFRGVGGGGGRRSAGVAYSIMCETILSS